MKQYEFLKLLQNPRVLSDIAYKIYEKDPKRISCGQVHFKNSLAHCDKHLYQQFRDGKITCDQLLARIEEKRFGTKYYVLDDLKGKIDDKFIIKDKMDDEIAKGKKFAQL